MSNQLTAEQQRKIEENRRKALERRAQRLAQSSSSSTSVQVQPPKHNANPDTATLTHHRDIPTSAPAPKRFAPPFKKDSQSIHNQNQDPNHQRLLGCKVNQSTLCNSAASSRPVRFVTFNHSQAGGEITFLIPSAVFFFLQIQIIDPLPQTRNQPVSSPVLSSFAVKPAHPKPDLTSTSSSSSSSSGGAVGSFYKQNTKPVAQLPSNSSTLNAVPAKKPAISARGKCVAHAEGRFRVEVGYHVELIAVFKSIPSKSYGKYLPEQIYVCLDARVHFYTLGEDHYKYILN